MPATKTFSDLYKRATEDGSLQVERTKLGFALQLEVLRRKSGQTRAQLARSIGKSGAYVTQALRGDTNFTIESMCKLTGALGGSVRVVVADASGNAINEAIREDDGTMVEASAGRWTTTIVADTVRRHPIDRKRLMLISRGQVRRVTLQPARQSKMDDSHVKACIAA